MELNMHSWQLDKSYQISIKKKVRNKCYIELYIIFPKE